MIDMIMILALVVLLINIGFLLLIYKKVAPIDFAGVDARLRAMEKTQERTEQMLREELARLRNEQNSAFREQRQELMQSLQTFGDAVAQRMMETAGAQKSQMEIFSAQLASFAQSSAERLDGVRAETQTGARQLRQEVVATLGSISETMSKTMGELSHLQKIQLDAMSAGIAQLSDTNDKKLEAVRFAVESKLQNIQTDNASQLEQMRQTVDEKLQGTLEKRLGESFQQVSQRLELVHKGLGEMQSLATGVGDLKKVLTNVKTRGTWGEVQLGALLEQALSPEQYASNISPNGSGERVEFAVRLPGQNADNEDVVWLPIDAKFPVEDYQRLIEAQERGDAAGVETAGKQLENRVKASAADICRKYLNPPKTTDFGIMFLPIEGLFAEVIRRTGLTETIQRECRVVIAGPTTLWSILNSLQMGFRTLTIQKRSSEVWTLLAAVKTEWNKYGDILDNVQNKLHSAADTIEKAKARSRAIGRRLKDVQELPAEKTNALLPDHGADDVSFAEEDASG